MYRKTGLSLGIVLTLGSLTACSKHDLAYYQGNLDEAQEKVAECEAAAEEAFKSADKEEITAILEDAECRAADKVHREHKHELAKLERKKRQEERERKRAEEEKAYQVEYEKQKPLVAALSIEEFYAAQKECHRTFSMKPAPKCKAIDDMKKEKDDAEIGALIKKYPGDALKTFNKESCQGLKFSEVYCSLSRNAVNKQSKDKVEYYLQNRQELKTVFNQCQKQIKALNTSSKWREANDVARTFKCDTVSKAAQKLRVFGFGKPIQ
jgi:hypothetical protein